MLMFCDIVSTYVDNCIGFIVLRSQQQLKKWSAEIKCKKSMDAALIVKTQSRYRTHLPSTDVVVSVIFLVLLIL